MNLNKLTYNVSEIFYSIQGEGTRAGLPCVFVRLQGCELRCTWCDTPYALEIKQLEKQMNDEEIVNEIRKYNCKFIMFTGGEPLNQPNILPLMAYLCDNNYDVVLETNGHQDISVVDKRVIKIMDFKTPGSDMTKLNNYNNINYLQPNDEVKFVIMDKVDYDWAKDTINRFNLTDKTQNIIFSPVFGKIEFKQLAEWILEDHIPVRMQFQMHKFIWEPNTRGV